MSGAVLCRARARVWRGCPLAAPTPTPAQLASWRGALEAIVPDVGLGDRLLGWFVPGEGVHFFSADAELGAILETAFASAFGAIWLDPKTQRPALRLELLGLQGETA